MDAYFTIKNLTEGLYKEKGSRFIAFAYPVQTIEQVKEILAQLHKKYHDARHICYAYSIGADASETRVNDDGEPSGTAGKPIQGVLLSNKLTFVLIAVVRYFGGVKLGTSGLITAYREAAADAIANAEIIEKTVDVAYQIWFEYPFLNDVMRIMKEEDCELFEQQFDMTCRIHFKIRKALEKQVLGRLEKVERLKIEPLSC